MAASDDFPRGWAFSTQQGFATGDGSSGNVSLFVPASPNIAHVLTSLSATCLAGKGQADLVFAIALNDGFTDLTYLGGAGYSASASNDESSSTVISWEGSLTLPIGASLTVENIYLGGSTATGLTWSLQITGYDI